MSTYHGVNACLAYCLNSVLNAKAVVATFNQEKALVGAFSVIVQLHQLIDLRHYSTHLTVVCGAGGGGGGAAVPGAAAAVPGPGPPAQPGPGHAARRAEDPRQEGGGQPGRPGLAQEGRLLLDNLHC